MTHHAIEVRALSKAYKIYSHPRQRLLEALWPGDRCFHRKFWALNDVNFEVQRGTTVGIIGMNGSGKSTLLQLIAGILDPTSGHVHTEGRIASLLELGSGFNPEFSGRENVIMNGAIMGFSREEMLERLPSIEEFASIGEFIDQPIKTYSTGMLVRLAFAAAVQVDPDILVVDEALSVGDIFFQHRGIRRLRDLQKRSKTVLFVSHDLEAVKSLCSKVLFLDRGTVQAFGDPSEVTGLFHAHVARLEAGNGEPGIEAPAPAPAPAATTVFNADPGFERRAKLFRHGNGRARVRNVELLGTDGKSLERARFDQEAVLRVHVAFVEDVPAWILGFILRDRTGGDIVGTNTYEEKASLPPGVAGRACAVDFRLRLPLKPGSYSVTVAMAPERFSLDYLDWVDSALVFEVDPPSGKLINAKVWLPVEITVQE